MRKTNKVTEMKTTNQEQMEISKKDLAWDQMLNSVQHVGKEKYVWVPMDLLYVDESIQRIDDYSKAKVQQLAMEWDDNLCDPIQVSIHPEEKKCSIINGMHRYLAANIKGMSGLTARLLELSSNPEERIVQEATIFVMQYENTERLSIMQRHKANVKRGVFENVALERIVNMPEFKDEIYLKKGDRRGVSTKDKVLVAPAPILNAIKKYGEAFAIDVFTVLRDARWNIAKRGLNSTSINAVIGVLSLHPQYRKQIVEILPKYMKNITPDIMDFEATKAYGSRRIFERRILYLEDQVCDYLGIDRIYLLKEVAKRENGNLERFKTPAA